MFEPKLRQLALKMVRLEETRMEQEKRKRAITASMANVCDQLENRGPKTPQEAKRVPQGTTGKEQQQLPLASPWAEDAKLPPQVPPAS